MQWYGMVAGGKRRPYILMQVSKKLWGPGFGLKAAPRHDQKKCYLHPKAIESAGRGVSSCQANTKIQNYKYKIQNIAISTQKKCYLHPKAIESAGRSVSAARQIQNTKIRIQNTRKLTQKKCHFLPKAKYSASCSVSSAAKLIQNTQDTQLKYCLHP